MKLIAQEPRVGGLRLWVDAAGPAEGPVAILIHGFPGLGRSWRHPIPVLARARWRVLVPDLRGFGRSEVPAEADAYAIDALTDDVAALIDHAGAEAVAIGGGIGDRASRLLPAVN